MRDHGTDRLAGVVLCDETPTCPADPADPEAWGEAPLAMDGIVLFLRLALQTPGRRRPHLPVGPQVRAQVGRLRATPDRSHRKSSRSRLR